MLHVSLRRRISPTSFSCLAFFFTFLTVVPSLKATAQGDLLIAPKRTVFEGRERYKELNVSNIGKDTARYEISLIHYRMKEDGSLEKLSAQDSGILFADSFVRFFPRMVTLSPGESQVVRLQLTQTSAMSNGEYRSHLYFRSVPKQKPLGEIETKKTDSNTFSIKLNAVFGIAVPVIIRVGETTMKVGLSNCSFDKSGLPSVKMTLERVGNMSCYGDITIDHVATSGTVTRVAELKGIAVYTPLEKRQVKLALHPIPGIDYTTGKLHVVYTAKENLSQNSIAQTEVYLN
ncbi:fimbrial biogenesis chaperone [Flavisolibacter nicotianae]|uniref:fimbria/pilus periplasmic chaperone n=1 Tax=Flavisolibacter nicotianae TaxID=2364882 RepID=UPI000EAB94B2|nr:fimbria/pilus periplasmic chaperone [Flavisolibacter nicotianae]